MPPELFGPLGLLIALCIAVGALWRIHTREDVERKELLDIAIEGWRAQTAASATSASAIEKIADRLPARSGRAR